MIIDNWRTGETMNKGWLNRKRRWWKKTRICTIIPSLLSRAFLHLSDQLREEKEERADEEKKDTMKINRLERELSETKELRHGVKREFDKMTKENTLASNLLRMIIF